MQEERKVSRIEKIGRKLPEISILFLILIGITAVFSLFLSGDHSFTNLDTTVTVKNAISPEGYLYIMDNMISNFITFAPLGIVLGIVIGVGVAEKTGLLGVVLKQVGLKTPEKALIPVIIFLGVVSSIASDAGYIVLIPLAGALFAALGKNPLIGIAAAFAGVSAGFGANIVPTPGDGLLGAITMDVAAENGIAVMSNEILMNYWFMLASTVLLTIVGTWVTNKFIVPKFKDREFILPEGAEVNSEETSLTEDEKTGLKAAKKGLIVLVIVIAIIALWSNFVVGGFYTDVATGSLVNADTLSGIEGYTSGMDLAQAVSEGLIKERSPLVDDIIVVMLFVFLVPGYMYGKATGQIKSSADYIKITTSAMADMSYILVLAFFAGNFVGLFGWTGIGHLIATGGAEFLIASGLSNYPLLMILGFIAVAAVINLFIGSASAKWTLLAPVFIPMLYSANSAITPEMVQVAYRVADSSTNIISPLMTYTGIVILYGKRYVKDFNYGTLMDMMYPYSFAFLIIWSAFLILWIAVGIPLGI